MVLPQRLAQPFYLKLLRVFKAKPILLIVPDGKQNKFFDMLCIRETIINQGIPDSIVKIIMSPWRKNAKQKYEVYVRHWIKYCQKHTKTTVLGGLNFTTTIFEKIIQL